MRFIKRLIAGFIIAGIILFLAVVISNSILKKPELSQNDLHVLWIMQGRDFFIETKSSNHKSEVLMQTNEELIRLNASKDYF